jgi:hypothetical protein
METSNKITELSDEEQKAIIERVQEMSPDELLQIRAAKEEGEANLQELKDVFEEYLGLRKQIALTGYQAGETAKNFLAAAGNLSPREIKLHKKAKERRAKRKRGGHK